MSKYREALLEYYDKHPEFILPAERRNEIINRVKEGLQDLSITRTNFSWGIPFPLDKKHVIYVWFDALINYISAIGWPNEMEKFYKWSKETGGMVQYCGKDNLRQQGAMWQAMLMAAGLPTSRQIIIHGFITSGGQKMSKSLGNVADPYQILSKL